MRRGRLCLFGSGSRRSHGSDDFRRGRVRVGQIETVVRHLTDRRVRWTRSRNVRTGGRKLKSTAGPRSKHAFLVGADAASPQLAASHLRSIQA
jgi:hypothetical protein